MLIIVVDMFLITHVWFTCNVHQRFTFLNASWGYFAVILVWARFHSTKYSVDIVPFNFEIL